MKDFLAYWMIAVTIGCAIYLAFNEADKMFASIDIDNQEQITWR